jgi:hypothetical protein
MNAAKNTIGGSTTVRVILCLTLVQKKSLVAWHFRLCWRGFNTPSILRHYLRRIGGVTFLATITPNDGGVEVV